MILNKENLAQIDEIFKDLFEHVALSLGPDGHMAIIMSPTQNRPIITKDGVTIAKYYVAPTPLGKVIATIIREICQSTDLRIGDGTTSTIVFAYYLYKELRKRIYIDSPHSYNDIMEGVDQAVADIIQEIDNIRLDMTDNEDFRKIAHIATNNNTALSNLIFEAVDSVGKGGSIVTRRSTETEDSIRTVEGFSFPSGYLSPNFITDAAGMLTQYNNPKIFVTNHALRTVKQIERVLVFATMEQKPLVIIAETVEDQALAALVNNNASGKLKICAVRAPGAGKSRQAFLEDVAFYTGARFIDKNQEMRMDAVDGPDFGQCEYFESKAGEAIIVGSPKTPEQIDGRVAFLKVCREEAAFKNDGADTTAEFDMFNTRINRLVSASATIFVGGFTDAEITEKRYRIEDAIRACQSAFNKGTLVGGGVVGLRLRRKMAGWKNTKGLTDVEIGEFVVFKTLDSIFLQLLKSSNLFDQANEIKRNILAEKNPNYGFNLKTKEYEDLRVAGVIEPAETFATVIQNALSIVKLILNCSAVILPPE